MYTVEIYRTDKRTRSGERLVLKQDYNTDNRSTLEKSVQDHLASNERYEIHETMVTRTNAMTGTQYQERYDVPFACSPRSENYWAM